MDSGSPLTIIKTAPSDFPAIIEIFEQVSTRVAKPGYKVWDSIDYKAIEKDITEGLQYKIVISNSIACVFSIQFSDPYVWGSKDRGDAIYLHRIARHQNFNGMGLFEKVKAFATNIALESGLKFLRMDTWAVNQQLIDYYRKSGFRFIEEITTPDTHALPVPNRNLRVALLELTLPYSTT